ncbi:hypothetical protein Acr_29g0006370 [Actinidia rufa]|uniref:Uncharacterized protein n=1 Tax=Actinidia rufa TaxID=165716 RepID=A0A7J0HEQ8_9ERIC|nr:hypothetical protein Acr_29g0006370 [Actinidia rufa]
MMDEVNQLHSSVLEESSNHGKDPEMKKRSPLEMEVSIMTLGKLDRLRESCFFPSNIQSRLPDDDEIIVSTCLGVEEEVLLHLKRQLGILPGRILGGKSVPLVLRLWIPQRFNKLPILTDLEEQRFNKVLEKIGGRGFFPVMTILGSKVFCKCFAFGRKKMASSGGDNAEDKHTEGAAQVVGDEGTSAHPGDVLGINASMLENSAVAEKLLKGMIPSFDREKQVPEFGIREQQATKELRKLRGEQDATVEGLDKEVAELKKKEGFNLCKKQIGRLHPELDIQGLEIDDELIREQE